MERKLPAHIYTLGLVTLVVMLNIVIAAEAPRAPFIRTEDIIKDGRMFQVLDLIHKAQGRTNAERLRRFHHFLTENPHIAGSLEGRRVARWIAEKYREAGFHVAIDGYKVLLSYPKDLRLELVEPVSITFDLREKGIIQDKDSFASEAGLPFNGYSADGDVAAQVVYVNYGTREDYQKLEKMGVDVHGKVVLARYGKIFRGMKVALAEQKGAAGVILYSDPRDDGYHRGDVYPMGPWRPDWAVQRGSVMWMTIYPGDPLTPGFSSIQSEKLIEGEFSTLPFKGESGDRHPLEIQQARNLPHIPVLPVSYATAKEILNHIGGPVAPFAWQGGLPLTYHVGPGAAQVHLTVKMDNRIEDIFNIIGWLPGAKGDEIVLIGNHHDAWTYGAVDPSSGTAALLELATVLGELHKEGIRPRRTVMLAAWDAEEYGLIGSTEFVERYRKDLQKKVIAYINCDSAVSGNKPEAGASPLLRRWIEYAASLVEHPLRPGSLLDAWREGDGGSPELRAKIGPLGSGSDYTAFLDHAGIPSMTLGLNGPYGVYHANIDDVFWMTHYTDPEYLWHRTAVRWLLTLALTGSESDLLPFNLEDYAEAFKQALVDIQQEIQELKNEEIVKSFHELEKTTHDWLTYAREFDERGRQAVKRGDEEEISRWNNKARKVESIFLDTKGIPGREWFRHLVYAPGRYLGYGAQALPSVHEALDDKEVPRVLAALSVLQHAIEKQVNLIKR